MKYLCLLVVLMLAAVASFGQTVTPLHGILNSNSLVDRPQNFRKMQENLRGAIERKEPGANLEYFTKKFGQMREEIMSLLVTPQLELRIQPDATRQRADGRSPKADTLRLQADALRLQADTLRWRADTLRWQADALHEMVVDSPKIADALRAMEKKRREEVGNLTTRMDSLISRADSLGTRIDTLILKWRDKSVPHAITEPEHPRDIKTDSIRAFLKDDLKAIVRKGLHDAFAGNGLSYQRETILQTLLDRLASLGVESHGKNGRPEERIAGAIADYWVNEMSMSLDIERYNWDISDQRVDSVLKRTVALLNANAGEVTQDICTKVTEALNTAETTVEGAYSQLNYWLVSANTGLAATSGEGDLSGGVMVSRVISEKVQLGFFVNGQIGAQDTSRSNSDTSSGSSALSNGQADTLITPVRTLLGVRIQVAIDPCGMDLVISKMVGEDLADTWEVGAALSVRLGSAVVLGAAYIYQYEDLGNVNRELIKHRRHHLIGLNLKGASSDSPAVLIALSKSEANEHWTPTLQVSFPFNVQK